jgi:hypothetical protein
MSNVRTVSKGELAELAGVSNAAISQQVKSKLSSAVVGGKIDIEHPSVVAYLRSKGAIAVERSDENPSYTVPVKPLDDDDGDGESILDGWGHGLDEREVHKFLNCSLRTILTKFGTLNRFTEFVKAIKDIEQIRERQLKNAVTEGSLCERAYVRDHIIGLVENSNARLLNDSPITIVTRVIEGHKAGQSEEELRDTVTTIIGSQIRAVKDKVLNRI